MQIAVLTFDRFNELDSFVAAALVVAACFPRARVPSLRHYRSSLCVRA